MLGPWIVLITYRKQYTENAIMLSGLTYGDLEMSFHGSKWAYSMERVQIQSNPMVLSDFICGDPGRSYQGQMVFYTLGLY